MKHLLERKLSCTLQVRALLAALCDEALIVA
jgi:hypothetical protein